MLARVAAQAPVTISMLETESVCTTLSFFPIERRGPVLGRYHNSAPDVRMFATENNHPESAVHPSARSFNP